MNQSTPYQAFGFDTPPQPFWLDSTEETKFPPLKGDLQVDTVIVGGGLVGITLAYLLKKEGLKVAVVEANRILQGTTAHTTAKLTSQHNLTYNKLINHFGKEKAEQYADANEHAINFVEQVINDKQIDCDFSRQEAYIYTQSDKYVQQIQEEVDAAIALGIQASYTENLPLPFNIKGAVRFDNQAQFHPRKYLLALAKEIPGDGSYIFEQSRAIDFQDGNPVTVTTENGSQISAYNMVLASHFPAYGSTGFYFASLYPERSYALGIKITEKFPGGMYITAENPGRSLRFAPYEDGELVIVAGERHKTGEGGNTNLHYKNLVDFAKANYQVTDIPYRWSTQDYTTLDEVPYVGKITSRASNVYIATGFKKWGMTNGTASAILLKDLIVKGESPWAPIFNPTRFRADPSVKNFITTNVNTAKHLGGGS